MATATQAQLQGMAAYLPVQDVDATVKYYAQVLGFRGEYVAGNPPEFAIVCRDGWKIMFRRVAEPGRISPNEKQGGTWDVFFWVRDVRGLHSELTDCGAEVVYGPVVQESYGMEEFAVRDQNGYVLGFGQSL